jgi:hypothetical protein
MKSECMGGEFSQLPTRSEDAFWKLAALGRDGLSERGMESLRRYFAVALPKRIKLQATGVEAFVLVLNRPGAVAEIARTCAVAETLSAAFKAARAFCTTRVGI